MKLEGIGFYTLSDKRAQESSKYTPLWRCELLLTDKCNFNCPYCQPLPEEAQGTLSYTKAASIVSMWISEGLKNVRFSGGEPTLWPGLPELVKMCKNGGVEHIAISTNGSMDIELYKNLIGCGVNDFSISLDSGCCAIGDKMAGGKVGSWSRVTRNIKEISKLTYVTVGMVFTESNIDTAVESIEFASSLGVADIRVISAAQYNMGMEKLVNLPQQLLDRHPILAYRVSNFKKSRNVRGMGPKDCNKCRLVLDDMAVAGNCHFPCIIYMRQGGKPIGKIGSSMRHSRQKWYERHNTHEDPICRTNCLDVCVDFNNKGVK